MSGKSLIATAAEAGPLFLRIGEGLPKPCSQGQFIGADRHGGLWLLRWDAGASLRRGLGWPVLRPLEGEFAKLIVAHAPLPTFLIQSFLPSTGTIP